MRFVTAAVSLALFSFAGATALAADAANPTLEDYIRSALEKNPDRQISKAALLDAEAERLDRASRLLPTVTVQGTRTFNEVESAFPFDPDGPGPAPEEELVFQRKAQNDAVLAGRMPLFDADAFMRWRAGRAGARAAAADDANSERDVAIEVARAYYSAAAAGEVVRAAERAKATADENKRIVAARMEVGATTQLLVDRAELEVVRAEQVLIDAKRIWNAARRTLATVSGLPEPATLSAPAPTTEAPAPEDSMLQAALAGRPDVIAARERLHEATRGRMGAWAAFAPRVTANGTERYTDAPGFAGEKTTWQATIVADWTLLDGGTRSAELKRQRAAIVRARARLADVENVAKDELHSAWLDVDAALAKVAAARRGDVVARSAADETRTRFKAGTVTQLDVIQADRDALQAEVDRIRAEGELSIARLALLRAAGAPLPGR